MNYKKVIIVILNYVNYKETEECINSVLQQEYQNYSILVVDNGSKNESYTYLKQKFKSKKKVQIIKTKKNHGFARGNNVGIYYARKNLQAEYVMLLNSDTVLTNKDYIRILVEKDEEDVGVIGSCIVQKDNKNIKKIYRHVTFPATIICYLQRYFESIGFSALQNVLDEILFKYRGAYILSGCMLLLTPSYFKFYRGLDSRTFLYCEEELLYLRCIEVNLKQKLVEEVSLLHKCGRSSKYLYKEKNKTYNKLFLESYKFVLWDSVKTYLKERKNIIKITRNKR